MDERLNISIEYISDGEDISLEQAIISLKRAEHRRTGYRCWSSGEELLKEDRDRSLDVVLYDINTDPYAFNEYITRFKSEFPGIRVICYSRKLCPEQIVRGVGAGASAVVTYDCLLTELKRIIETANVCAAL